MPAVFPSWFNSRPVSSLTGRVWKKFNGSLINYVAYEEAFQRRPSGRAETALSWPVVPSD